MPWTCTACQQLVTEDGDAVCPSCGSRKTAWTILGDQTRTLVVGGSKKRFECLRGDWSAPVAGAEAYAEASWFPTDVVPAMHVEAARKLVAEGRLPAPRDLLTVREFPAGAAERDVDVTVEFAQRAADERALPGPDGEPDAQGAVDARVLAVWGADQAPPDDVVFPGVAVLDVSEGETPEGFAPTIQAAALRRPKRRLRVVTHDAVFRAVMRGLFFETDKAFLLPIGVPALRRLRAFHDEHPGGEVLVVGHTDTTGAKAHNLKLSVERAQAVAAYLQDDVDHWLPYFTKSRDVSKPWGTREVQWMLSALPDDQPPEARFWVGEPTGKEDAATKDGVARFQAFSNDTRGTSLEVDGIAGPLTKRELVAAYMEIDGTTLPEGTLLRTHGCGELHPEVDAGDEANVQENRRVELFLFEKPPGTRPLPKECADPGCEEYPQWLASVVETIDLSTDPPASEPLLAASLYFAPDRTFVRPGALPLLRTLLERAAADPAARLVVVGHDEPRGDPALEDALSLVRAETVRALLVNDLDRLRERFERADGARAWDWEEVQWMLLGVDVAGFPTYVGIPDGFPGDDTLDALGLLQGAHGLKMHHRCDEQTLRLLLERYSANLGPARIAADRIDAVGAGSRCPTRPGAGAPPADPDREEATEPRRRVDVFLAPTGDLVPKAAHPVGPASYDRWVKAVAEEVRPPSESQRFTLRFVDGLEASVVGLAVQLIDFSEEPPAPVASLTTNGFGCVGLTAPAGRFAARVTHEGETQEYGFVVDVVDVGGMTVRLGRRVGE